jgi:hypothetical protein
MIVPSAHQKIPDFEKKILISRGLDHSVNRNEFSSRIAWATAVQQTKIPFHNSATPYEGFAIVPRIEGFEPQQILVDIEASRAALIKLKSVAPDPAAQSKFAQPPAWLQLLENQWRDAAQEYARNPIVGQELART